ncbi:hypothetical protein SSCG_02241 [Streptomyces clavuligerus]|nr:hypothetical protein SSCG_02241 [Streptomyces clavuligerus]
MLKPSQEYTDPHLADPEDGRPGSQESHSRKPAPGAGGSCDHDIRP